MLEWLYKKNDYSHRNICFEAIQNGVKSNSAPGLNRGQSSNLWNWEVQNKWRMSMEEHVFAIKMFREGQNSIQDEKRPGKPTIASSLFICLFCQTEETQ